MIDSILINISKNEFRGTLMNRVKMKMNRVILLLNRINHFIESIPTNKMKINFRYTFINRVKFSLNWVITITKKCFLPRLKKRSYFSFIGNVMKGDVKNVSLYLSILTQPMGNVYISWVWSPRRSFLEFLNGENTFHPILT